MGAPPILTRRTGATLEIVLNRPASGNALDQPMADALLAAVIAGDEDRAVRCVLLSGTGRFFCTGGDLAAFPGEEGDRPPYIRHLADTLHAALLRLARMDKPLVNAINGPAAGAGIGLAVIGDIALAAAGAHFTLAYTAAGLSPDAGASWLLPRLIGLRRAQELCLTNRRVGAEEAAAIGLVTRVVAADALAAEAGALAERLAAGSTGALGATRRLLLASAGASLEAQLEAEADCIAERSRTRDGGEGIAAFLAKRAPMFIGD